MKVVAFNGSPRKEGNTFQSLQIVMAELQKEGIETELIQVGGKALHGCTACYGCYKNKDRECVIKKDDLNSYVAKMIEADGIIIGSPVYFSNVTSEVKAFMDRAGLVARANDYLLDKKYTQKAEVFHGKEQILLICNVNLDFCRLDRILMRDRFEACM